MDWKLGGLILFLAMPAYASDGYGPTREQLGAEYKACMLKATAKYGAKTDRVDDAIDAARADCEDERIAIQREVFATWIANGKSAYQARQAEKAVIQKVDALLRPELARAALRAK